MSRETYRLTESVGAFPEGEILDVTARFGDWHIADLELEPRSESALSPSKLVVTEADVGFSEEAILDPTARIGDWHEYELAFEPGHTDDDPTRLTAEAFEAVAEPIDATA
jgi:hypothetical protein